MSGLISDFRGRISHLAFSDDGLTSNLPLVKVKLQIARSLFSALLSNNVPGILNLHLNIKINDSIDSIQSEDEFEQFEKNLKKTSKQKNKQLVHGFGFDHSADFKEGHAIQAGSQSEDEEMPIDCLGSKFIRDHFLVFIHDTKTVIMDNCYRTGEGKPNPRLENLLVRFNYRAEAATLGLAGGDILVADSLVLVGRRTLNELGIGYTGDLLGQMQTKFDQAFFCPCPENVNVPDPLYHIDVYLTILGEEANGIHVAIGRIHTWDKEVKGWKATTTSDGSKGLQSYLDAVRKILEDAGRFKITEWPLLYEVVGGKARLYTYNNCLVERISDSLTRIWLPSYVEGSVSGEKKFQKLQNNFEQQILKEFTPIWIGGCLHDEVAAKASLRCLTQVLSRATD